MRAARAARLIFIIQPIKSLICGVVVTVALVSLARRATYPPLINQSQREFFVTHAILWRIFAERTSLLGIGVSYFRKR